MRETKESSYYLTFEYFDFQRNWLELFQKRVLCTTLD